MSTKHSLIQERLNLKRTPLDEWNTHEQLCLASAVACSGDQNWMSVSRALKGIVNTTSRPHDWFISKSCATQYGKLLESVETPKRKKRTASERDQPAETPSTPVDSLVKKLTTERIIELKKGIAEVQQQYMKIKEEVMFLQSSSMDETKIREMWQQIEQEKIQKEREQVKYDQWLQEREEKKLEIERQWRPNYKAVVKVQQHQPETPQEQAGTSTAPSPLLTSLLKSQVAASAPTITNLLTGTLSSPTSTTSSSNSPTIIAHSSPAMLLPINHSASVQIPVSQSAPTLVTLLDKKPSQDPSTSEKQQLMMSIDVPESGGKDGGDVKDDDADLLADFNELIAEKFDEEDLEDINAIIMNPEILEDKIAEDEIAPKDEDEASNGELRIKKLVDDLVGAEGKEVPISEPEVIQVQSDVENSNPPSEETPEPPPEVESPPEDKVLLISDESSDGKKEVEVEAEPEKIEDVEEETKSDVVKDEDSKEVQESDDSAEKDVKEPPPVYPVEDSDEDVLFEDAKENHEESSAKEPEVESVESAEPVKEPEAKATSSVDTDDEVLETKASRNAARKKAVESTPVDDNPSIRTRSRHSSTITSEPKSTFNFSKEQDHSMWKARWDDCLKELQKHKDYATVVDNKIFSEDSFKSVILCPMNMKIIQKNIENHVSTLPGDVKRDFAMMCTNICMWNKKGSKFNDTVIQFLKYGMEIIDNNLEVEDVYKSYRKQIKKKN